MNLTMASFYSDVWWPDMKTLAKERGLKYTAMTCFDYQNKTTPPFLTQEWETNTKQASGKNMFITDWLMHQVAQDGHEVALHGFNHVSLVKENWPRWEYMETAMSTAYKKWKAEQYAPMPVTYVPPSNYIDSLGLISLEMAVPSVKYVCSTFDGITSEGGNREFDPEPYNQFFFNFPRITSGYLFDDTKEYQFQSTFIYTGIWSHFIHPDDVYQIKGAENESSKGDFDYRNPRNLGWRKSANGEKGMLPYFKEHLTSLVHTYPMLRFMNTQDAAQATQQWRYQRFIHTETKTNHVVQPLNINTQRADYWMVYIPKENWQAVTSVWNKKQIPYSATPFQQGNLAMFKDTNVKIEIPQDISVEVNPALTMVALQDFKNYTKGIVNFETIDEEIAWLISEYRIGEAIHILSNKIADNGYESYSDIEELLKLLRSEDREFDIWPILENAYQANSINQGQLIDFSLQIIKDSDYPTLEIRKNWMQRQLQLYPNNIVLWTNYISYFSEEVKNLSNEQLLRLFQETSEQSQKTFYAILLAERDPDTFLAFLQNQTPCQSNFLKSISTTAAWLYADRQEYEKAIAWSNCSTAISKADLVYWHSISGDLEYVKDNDYGKYMELLLMNDPTAAIQELMNAPVCSVVLQPQSTSIAYLFANNKLYRKAIAWAECSSEITFAEQLYWYSQLKAYSEMEIAFQSHMAANPNDLSSKYAMAQTYAQIGMIEKSWQLAATLPYTEEYAGLRTLLNKEVLYVKTQTKKTLLSEYSDYFFPKTYEYLRREQRLNEGFYLRITNEIIADRLSTTSIDNQVVAGISFGSKLTHEFGITQTTARAIEIDTTNIFNKTQHLVGASYTLKSKNVGEKLTYEATARLERNTENDYYYRLLGQISKNKDSTYSSLTISHQPAITGPAYSLDIYNTQLTAYYENLNAWKKYRLSVSLEGNYYSDDVLDAQLTTALSKSYKAGIYSKWNVYSEVFGMLGNEDRSSGFPYWTIDKRLYGGVGLNFQYNQPNTKFQYALGVAVFADTFSDFFQRFKGEISCEILPYLFGSMSAEFYTLKDFYSNNVNFAIRYYFKTN